MSAADECEHGFFVYCPHGCTVPYLHGEIPAADAERAAVDVYRDMESVRLLRLLDAARADLADWKMRYDVLIAEYYLTRERLDALVRLDAER